jgi:hypothetical protein
VEGVASAGVLDVSRADGILANTAAPTVCITSDLPVHADTIAVQQLGA